MIYHQMERDNETTDDDDIMPVCYPSLEEIYNLHFKNGWPDMNTEHSYLPVYEERLAEYRMKAQNILEVGLFTGQRFLIWKDYFKGKVWGIDCDEQPHGGMADLRPLIAQGENIFIGDAESQETIKKFFEGIKFEVILEDAGHGIEQQVKIFNTLKPYMNKGGLYACEDVQNIDETRNIFESISPENKIEILDRRNIKNRFDDVIVLIYF